jgi:hypothetical protein
MNQLQSFAGIMLFYALLSYVLFPVAFYFLFNKSLTMAGNGFIVGSVISILLWFFVGKSFIK